MTKEKKGSSSTRAAKRVRTLPSVGKPETVEGTKAGKKRQMLPFGHPDRTHDGPRFRARKSGVLDRMEAWAESRGAAKSRG